MLVLVLVHGGLGTKTVNEKMELKLVQNHFLGYGTGTANEKMEPKPKRVPYMGRV